jgi:hypothetical protein
MESAFTGSTKTKGTLNIPEETIVILLLAFSAFMLIPVVILAVTMSGVWKPYIVMVSALYALTPLFGVFMIRAFRFFR